MSEDKRERAILLIHSLTILANDTRAPHGEREAAQNRIAHLQAKYKIAPIKPDPDPDAVLAELRKQKAKQDAANAEWERKKQEHEAKRAREEAQRGRQGDIFDEALRKDGRTRAQKNADMQNRHRAGSGWNESTKYRAAISHVYRSNSRSGNPMVTIEYRISYIAGTATFKGWYVLNNEWGVKALLNVATTLLGPEARDWPIDKVIQSLQGMTCTVMLTRWDDGKQWKVDVVMPPWS